MVILPGIRAWGAPVVSDFEAALVTTATGQFQQFQGLDENDSALGQQIKTYWSAVGQAFPGVSTAWSAVFISWCMKTAGATKREFQFSARHAVFVNAAIRNAETASGLFRGLRVDECVPTLGDLIHNNRNNNKFSYDFAATHDAYESHSAIVVALGQDLAGRFATTIGGNEGVPGSVGRKRVALNEDGLVIQRASNPYICVVQCLK